ncbi:MAG: thiol-activated cytolysin family protein [Gemmatimonadaceae bacterium]
MRSSLQWYVTAGLLAAAMMVPSACGERKLATAPNGADPAGLGATAFDAMVTGFGIWNGALSDTAVAAPVALPQTVISAANGDNWVCSNTQLNEKRNLDELLVPGSTAGVMWPGALIQGASLINGEPAEIPLARSPISISINLAVDSASRTIADPTSASVQAAVAQLQRAADSRLGSIDVVPAQIDFQQTEAFASNQFILSFGGSVQASAPLKSLDIPLPGTASLGVSDSGGVKVSFEVHTIAVKLMQPMYTISFADEPMSEPGDYLAPSVTDSEVQDVAARGMLGPANLPTYVKSVTYGRMVVFTMRNTSFATTADLEGAVQASLNLFKLGQGSGSSKLSVQDSLLLQNSDLRVVAFGGSQDSALAAIRTGDLGKFFTSVPATQAVALGYRVNYLKDGTVALLGQGTTYTENQCAPTGTTAQYWSVALDSLTSNGGCDSTNYVKRSDFVLHFNDGTEEAYPLIASSGGPMTDTAVDRDVVVRIPPETTPLPGSVNVQTFMTQFFVDAYFTRDTACVANNPSPCFQVRDFTSTEQFAALPYVFDLIITLPGADDACTVNFHYTVNLQPALDRSPMPRGGATGAATAVSEMIAGPPPIPGTALLKQRVRRPKELSGAARSGAW